MNQKRIVYLVGLPCSGKTTFIEDNFYGGVVISNDDIYMGYANSHGLTYAQAHAQYDHKKVLSVARQIFDKAVAQGESFIVIDAVNHTANARARYRAEGYRLVAYVLNIDDQTREKRTRARVDKVIPRGIVKQMKLGFQNISKSEGFDEVYYPLARQGV